MVSVIVPVFNVEKYLRKCLNSVINQTYKNLEILIIDDGSTDRSGLICDEYTKDNRVRVIHQDNKGLSSARNGGINIATGTYILFIDGDDYIEPNTVECLLQACNKADAEAVCCGHYKEYSTRSIAYPLTKEQKCYEGNDLIPAVMRGSTFSYYAWGKLLKRELFVDCSFPEGMLFEDIDTIWRLLIRCHRIVCIPDILFHYVYRKSSLGNTKTKKNLIDRWIAFKNRYDAMAMKSDELNQICTKGCLDTIGYTWRWLYVVKDLDEDRVQEMRLFAKANKDCFYLCSIATRVSLFCAIHSNTISIFCCYCVNQFYRRIRGMDQTV